MQSGTFSGPMEKSQLSHDNFMSDVEPQSRRDSTVDTAVDQRDACTAVCEKVLENVNVSTYRLFAANTFFTSQVFFEHFLRQRFVIMIFAGSR